MTEAEKLVTQFKEAAAEARKFYTVAIYMEDRAYGGPEEGGWYYHAGYPVLTHCIFSKKQAVQTFIQYFDEYEIQEQPSLGLSTTYSNYEVNFSTEYAKVYPESKPHYC